jgi:hypothetical protein
MDEGFRRAIEFLEDLKRVESPRILNFSHHDLDGVSSAAIIKRLLQRYLNATVVTKLPPKFMLTKPEVKDALADGPFDALVISDKGTFDHYDDFLEYVENVLVIDHHLSDGVPKRCVVYNPSAHRSVPTAASLLCYMLAEELDLADDHDDFAALMGCRGDFVFDPVLNNCEEFAKPFIEQSMTKFKNMFEPKVERPTMFDLVDRERTTLVNQIGELLHAGCLAHLYRPAEGVYGPELVLHCILKLADEKVKLNELNNLQDLLNHLPISQVLLDAYNAFKSDWDLLAKRAENTILLNEVQGVGIYLIFAREAPAMQAAPFPAILPYVAMTKLHPLRTSRNHQNVLMIVFCPKTQGVHISMRSTGGILDCNILCSELARRIRALYRQNEGISGGGHEKAAECFISGSVPMYAAMHELMALVREIVQFARGGSANNARISPT